MWNNLLNLNHFKFDWALSINKIFLDVTSKLCNYNIYNFSIIEYLIILIKLYLELMGTCSNKKKTLKCINLRHLQSNLISEGPASPTLIFSKRNDHILDFNYVDEVIQPSNLINENYLKYYK